MFHYNLEDGIANFMANRTVNEVIGTSPLNYLLALYKGDVISDHIESSIPQEKGLKKRVTEAIKSDPSFYRVPDSSLSNSKIQELITRITAIYAKFMSMQTNIFATRTEMTNLDFNQTTELVDKYLELAKLYRLTYDKIPIVSTYASASLE